MTFFPQPNFANDKCWKISVNSLRISIKIKYWKCALWYRVRVAHAWKFIHIYIYLYAYKNHPFHTFQLSFCEVCTIWIVMFPNRICTRSQKFSNYAHTSGIIWMSLSWASFVPFFLIFVYLWVFLCVYVSLHCLRCLEKTFKVMLNDYSENAFGPNIFWQQHLNISTFSHAFHIFVKNSHSLPFL